MKHLLAFALALTLFAAPTVALAELDGAHLLSLWAGGDSGTKGGLEDRGGLLALLEGEDLEAFMSLWWKSE